MRRALYVDWWTNYRWQNLDTEYREMREEPLKLDSLLIDILLWALTYGPWTNWQFLFHIMICKSCKTSNKFILPTNFFEMLPSPRRRRRPRAARPSPKLTLPFLFYFSLIVTASDTAMGFQGSFSINTIWLPVCQFPYSFGQYYLFFLLFLLTWSWSVG